MATIHWKDLDGKSCHLDVRNIGELNKESSIQMELEIIPPGTARTKRQSISIPLEKVEEFLEAVKKKE